MHFDLDRRLARRRARRSSRRRCAPCSPTSAPSVSDFPAMADRARRMVQLAGAGAARYARRRGRRDRRLPRVAAARQLHLPRLPRVPLPRRGRSRSCPAPGSGSSPTTASSTYAKPVPRRLAVPRRARARARGRPADRLQDQPALARAPARADGLRRRAPDLAPTARSSARRGCSACSPPRPTPSPRAETPLLHRKLRQILRPEDLIEGSHDYKAAVSLFDSFPKDELFAALDRRPARRGRGAAGAAGRPGAAARPPRPRRAQRLADRRAAALALRRRRCSSACATLFREPLRDRRGRLPPRARRGRPRAGALPRPRRRRACPTSTSASSSARSSPLTRTWDDELRDALIARHGEAAGPRARRREWGAALPALLQGARPTPSSPSHDIGCFARLETLGEPFVVGLQNEPTRAASARASASTRRGGKVELVARRCRCSRTSGCA